jgi:capsular exopolysaccharide synthesis family protein
VAAVKHSLDRELKGVERIAKARVQSAGEEVGKIAAALEVAKKEGMRVTKLEVEFDSLKRETDALAKQYALVQNRTKEAELTAKVKGNNLHVLDYARLPRVPVSPRLMLGALIAFALSLLLSVLAAVGIEVLDRTLKTLEDVEKMLGLPCLGALPHLDRTARVTWSIAESPTSTAAERCRLIRRNLLLADHPYPLRRILVTGAQPKEGKTLTSISLAMSMAQSGLRVLLVDCDLRRPSLGSALAPGVPIGLTSVVCGGASLDETIRETAVPNLYLLPAGPLPTNPSALADSERLGKVLQECSLRFDRVVLDTSSLLGTTDPALVARHCDGVVMVVRAGQTKLEDARSAHETLISAGAHVVGVVLNDVETRGSAFRDRYPGERVIDVAADAEPTCIDLPRGAA